MNLRMAEVARQIRECVRADDIRRAAELYDAYTHRYAATDRAAMVRIGKLMRAGIVRQGGALCVDGVSYRVPQGPPIVVTEGGDPGDLDFYRCDRCGDWAHECTC